MAGNIISQLQQIGGNFEALDLDFNPMKTGTGAVKSVTGALDGLFDSITGKPEKKSLGSLFGFDKPRPKEASEKEQKEAAHKRIFFSSMEEAQNRFQRAEQSAKINLMARLDVAGMPTTQKNKDLHLSLDLDEKHTNDLHHGIQLLNKRIEQIRQAEENKQKEDMASIGPNIVADFNAAAEGGMGKGSHRMSQASGGE